MMRLNSILVLNVLCSGSAMLVASCAESSKNTRQPLTDAHQVNPGEDGENTGTDPAPKKNGEVTAVEPAPEDPKLIVEPKPDIIKAPPPAVARFRASVIGLGSLFKTTTAQGSTLAENEKCALRQGESFDVKTSEPAEGAHTKIELMVARTGCTFTTGYVYNTHVKVGVNPDYAIAVLKK